MKVVVLVEFNWDGHHPPFFKLYARTLLELNCKVLALCPNPDEVIAWIEENAPDKREHLRAAPFFALADLPITEHRLRSVIATLLFLYQATRIIRNTQVNPFGPPDLVFYACVYSARWVFPLLADLLMPYTWSCLFMSPAENIAKFRGSKRVWPLFLFDRFALLRARNCCAVLSYVETANEELSRILRGKPVLMAPDNAVFTLERAAAHPLVGEVVERARGRKIVGQFGIMRPSKGLITLLRAAAQLDPTRYFFVALGPLSSDPDEGAACRAEIEAEPAVRQENVLVRYERIPDEACYNALVAQCDVLFMAYLRFSQSSGNMVKAAHFRKPIIVSKGYLMGERVRIYRLGAAITEGNAEECCEAIQELTKPDWVSRVDPGFEEFSEMHSANALPALFRNLLKIAGNGPLPAR